MRRQTRFAPGSDAVVPLAFELPVAGTVAAAVSLKSHEPSPRARQFVAQLRTLAAAPSTAAAAAPKEAALVEAAP